MLTRADDYPIHQTPEPVAFAGTDRNFYDRYFFNGQSPDGGRFFAAALGVYPHLNVVDAAFSVRDSTAQTSVFASRLLAHERLDTFAGPIRVEVLEPLRTLKLSIAPNDHGLAAELTFAGRAPPIEEPRFIRRVGSRTLMDVTRITANGEWSGWLEQDGQRFDAAGWRGTRDRSWGVRPIGAADPQPLAPPAPPQFFWLWAPLNFDRHALFFHSNDEADGTPWNRSLVLVPLDGGAPVKLREVTYELSYRPGTRHATAAVLTGAAPDGPLRVELAIKGEFFMSGIGYGHPTRGHGTWHGAESVAGERLTLAAIDRASPASAHVQALAAATMTLPDGTVQRGRGVLEQLVIGPHAPSGFRDLFDVAG